MSRETNRSQVDPLVLDEMAERVVTQDNCGTSDPIFLLQERVRDYGYDADYADGVVLLDEEGDEVDSGGREVYYKDRWRTVQPFFSEVGAEAYRAENHHNLGECRIYVASAYRNREWCTIRAMLADLHASRPSPGGCPS